MFFRFKMKLATLTSKQKRGIVFFFLLLSLSIVGCLLIWHLPKEDNTIAEDTLVNTEETVAIEEDVEENIDTNEESVSSDIYGSDIKTKYNEVKNTDYAILVATTKLLEGLEPNDESSYQKHAIDETNTIVEIKDANGNYMKATFVNFNRLLKDTVVIQDVSGGYVTVSGFVESEKQSTKFHKYTPSTSLEIADDAIFADYPIYDGSYNEIGVLYIETKQGTSSESNTANEK